MLSRCLVLVFGAVLACNALAVADEPGASVVSQAEAPVMIDSCQAYLLSNYEAMVGIAFHATTETATAVAFVFGVQDPFGSVATWYSGTTAGTFSPGVTIEPKKPALNPNIFQSRTYVPQNPAWTVFFSQSASPENVRCEVYKVRLADGTIWLNPALGNIYPVAASE